MPQLFLKHQRENSTANTLLVTNTWTEGRRQWREVNSCDERVHDPHCRARRPSLLTGPACPSLLVRETPVRPHSRPWGAQRMTSALHEHSVKWVKNDKLSITTQCDVCHAESCPEALRRMEEGASNFTWASGKTF